MLFNFSYQFKSLTECENQIGRVEIPPYRLEIFFFFLSEALSEAHLKFLSLSRVHYYNTLIDFTVPRWESSSRVLHLLAHGGSGLDANQLWQE